MIASLFLSANLGFITGIISASFSLSKIILVLSLIALFFKPKKFKIILCFCLFSSLGLWRYSAYGLRTATFDYSQYQGQKVIAYGRVSEEIDPGGNYQKLTVRLNKINEQPVNSLILVTSGKYPPRHYGDNLKLEGKLEAPDNWSSFRYDRYLARYDIYSLMSWPKVTLLSNSSDFYSYLLSLKAKVYYLINAALPEPEAGLANALLLGYKGTLMTPEKNAFSCCGLSHIVAISGSHLTLLSALAFNFLLALGLSSRRAFRPVVIFLWFYTVLTGIQTSALRSAIMISLVLWGKKNGRGDSGGRLLFVTAAVMLFFNPLLLRDDLGFELSFLAMLALIYLCPLGEKIFGKGNIKSTIILTVASQLLTWPISAYNFGTFSVIAPLANVLIVWLFAWLLPILLISSGLSLLIPSLGVLWFAPAYFMLAYINFLGRWLAARPGACVNLTITSHLVLIYYFIVTIIYLILNKFVKRQPYGIDN